MTVTSEGRESEDHMTPQNVAVGHARARKFRPDGRFTLVCSVKVFIWCKVVDNPESLARP